MLYDKYYKGYEGETQIRFETGASQLVIWEGYIYTLMEDMFDQGLKILSDYYSSEDDDNWEIENLDNAIAQFRLFDLNKITKEELTSISATLPGVVKEIVSFLSKALFQNRKVYISKD